MPHATQTAYNAALDSYNAALAEVGRRSPALAAFLEAEAVVAALTPEIAEDAQIEAWSDACDAVRAEVGSDALALELRAAEDALLAWSEAEATATARTHYQGLALERALDAIATVYAAARRSGRARGRTLDLAMRLAA